MKITCPRCGGKELLNDLGLIQTDLYYSRGRLHGVRQADSPNAGPPPLACDVCKGQGWVTTEAYGADSSGLGGLFRLHQTPDGFWIILDVTSSATFEGHFDNDPGASGFVIIRTDANQGLFPTLKSPDFITLQ